jgi:hypothetical protein
MDCDQVFMILTRGPFPTGEQTDELVEAHLEACGACWRMAEALRPAQEIFQEAVPAAEGRDLPGYWGDARPTPAATAQLTRLAPFVTALRQRSPSSARVGLLPASREGRWTTALSAAALASAFTAIVLGVVVWFLG